MNLLNDESDDEDSDYKLINSSNNSINNSNNNNNNNNNGNSMKERLKDQRIYADYAAWVAGPRLNDFGLHAAYSSIDIQIFNQNNSKNGNNGNRLYSTGLLESVVRPDLSSATIMKSLDEVLEVSLKELLTVHNFKLVKKELKENHWSYEIIRSNGLANVLINNKSFDEICHFSIIDVQVNYYYYYIVILLYYYIRNY